MLGGRGGGGRVGTIKCSSNVDSASFGGALILILATWLILTVTDGVQCVPRICLRSLVHQDC